MWLAASVLVLSVFVPRPLGASSTPVVAGSGAEAPRGAHIGDVAPPLDATQWFTGTPAAALEPGRVHLVVFWAPWSGASTQALTRLAETQRRNAAAGVVVTAITGPDARGARLSAARARVRELAEWTSVFRCGWDGRATMSSAWLGAAGERALPCAFLVDKNGRIAAIGAPPVVELRLASVLAGTHDLAALAQEAVDHATVEGEVVRAENAFQLAYRARDWDRALALCDELLRLDRDGQRRMTIARFQILLLRLGRADEAYEYGHELSSGIALDDVGLLTILAWTVVDPDQKPPRRDLAFAGQCAQRAVDLSLRRNATLLDTLARVHHAQGELDQAIAIESEAVRLDPFFAGTLADYRREQARR